MVVYWFERLLLPHERDWTQNRTRTVRDPFHVSQLASNPKVPDQIWTHRCFFLALFLVKLCCVVYFVFFPFFFWHVMLGCPGFSERWTLIASQTLYKKSTQSINIYTLSSFIGCDGSLFSCCGNSKQSRDGLMLGAPGCKILLSP